MSNHDSRPSSKWNAVRSKAIPSNVTASVTDTQLLAQKKDDAKSKRRKEVLPAKLHRQPGYFESGPQSSTYK